MLEDIRKVKSLEILISVVCFLAIIAPGFLMIFLYNPQLIKELDFAKLIVFSSALSLPFIVVQLVCMIIFSPKRFMELSTGWAMLAAAIAAMVTLYVCLVLAYLNAWPLKTFGWAMLGMSMVVGFATRWIPYDKPTKR